MTDPVLIARKEDALDDYIEEMLGVALAPPQQSLEQLLASIPEADEESLSISPQTSLTVEKLLTPNPGVEVNVKAPHPPAPAKSVQREPLPYKDKRPDPLQVKQLLVQQVFDKTRVTVKPKAEVKQQVVPVADVRVAVKAPDTSPQPKPIVQPPVPVKSPPVFRSYKDADWALQKFQCLFFSVCGLTVAVPLIELGGIHVLENVTRIPKKPAWYLGMMAPKKGQRIHVVDSAMWIMPERYHQVKAKLDYKHVVMLGNSRWGLAAGELTEAISVSPGDVQWRQQSGKRPWLGGIVKKKMCTLLHVEALIQQLETAYNAGHAN